VRKAELEDHHEQYLGLESKILAMVERAEFPALFAVCIETFPHIVPAMKYAKQAGVELAKPDLTPLATICRYAPALFEHPVIESLVTFLRSTRLLARHENGYLAAAEHALTLEETARAIWNHIERTPGALQRELGQTLGADQTEAAAVVEVWERLDILIRKQEGDTCRLDFRYRIDSEVEGVCHSCGARGRGRKEVLLKPIACPKCRTTGYFHMNYGHSQ
jgi:hypothetical protein